MHKTLFLGLMTLFTCSLFALRLASNDFFEGGELRNPTTMPEMILSDPPPGTKSFALIVDDPDASHFTHLVAYNIPPNTKELGNHAFFSVGMNGWGEMGWGALKPPKGEKHRYVFTLYALDLPPILPQDLSRPELEGAIDGHIRGETTTFVQYGQGSQHSSKETFLPTP